MHAHHYTCLHATTMVYMFYMWFGYWYWSYFRCILFKWVLLHILTICYFMAYLNLFSMHLFICMPLWIFLLSMHTIPLTQLILFTTYLIITIIIIHSNYTPVTYIYLSTNVVILTMPQIYTISPAILWLYYIFLSITRFFLSLFIICCVIVIYITYGCVGFLYFLYISHLLCIHY